MSGINEGMSINRKNYMYMKYLTILNTKLLTDFNIKILISNTILLEYYLSYAKVLARQANRMEEDSGKWQLRDVIAM